MDKNKILHADLLDIIFDQRNKVYGAYELRRTYHQRLKRSALAGLSFVSAVLFFPVLAALHPTNVNASSTNPLTPTILDPIDIPTPTPPKPVEPTEPTTIDVSTVKLVDPAIVPASTLPEDPLPSIDDLKDHAISDQDFDSDHDGAPTEAVLNPGENDVAPSSSNITVVETDTKVYGTEEIPIEAYPSFPGGEEEMMKYVQEHIEYPKLARETDQEGKVVVSFVIDKEGKITSLELVRGSGFGMDEEAMRVIKSMPKWKPGHMNGHPVSVKFYMPLDFTLQK